LDNQVKYRNCILNYSIFGSGQKTILAFHGFGQDNKFIIPLVNSFEDYTIYSFDLFFHGKSAWNNNDLPITKSFLNELMEKFFIEKGIENFSLLGYSIGCKFVFSILESFGARLERVILIAPDGIYNNFWYSFSTKFWLTRRAFNQTAEHPSIFLSVTSLLEKLNVADKALLKFAKTQMNTREKRLRVYHSWVVFRLLLVNPSITASVLNDNNIDLEIYLAKNDKVIEEKHLRKFLMKVKNCRIEIIDAFHHNLISKVAEHLK
jgi:pimeloyl-ACP methyl ester carboxylesterase